MTQHNRTIVRWFLQGICVLGILIGVFFIFSFFIFIFFFVFPIPRDDLLFLCLEFLASVFMLALGVFLICDSYLMLRGKAFGAIKDFSVLVALMFFSLVGPLCEYVESASVGKKKARFIEEIIGVSFLISFWLVYLICKKLLKRLVELAYGPEKMSGTQNSVTERKENTSVEST